MRVISKFFDTDVGIDLGSSRTRVCCKGLGRVLDEPSIVTVDPRLWSCSSLVAGWDATHGFFDPRRARYFMRPMQGGEIADMELVIFMIGYFIDKACSCSPLGKFVTCGTFLRLLSPAAFLEKLLKKRRHVLITVPSCVTDEEKKALGKAVRLATWIDRETVRESEESFAKHAGHIKVSVIEKSLAAAIGAGLPVSESKACMVVDVGAGSCEVAIIYRAGIVHGYSARGVGGDDMDNAIMAYIRDRYNLRLSDTREAERIKIEIGGTYPTVRKREIYGLDALTWKGRSMTVTSKEISEVLQEPMNKIIEAVRVTLDRCEPELAADIGDNGIVMTGGGALLPGLDRRLADATGLPVRVADDPGNATIRGVSIALNDPGILEKNTIKR